MCSEFVRNIIWTKHANERFYERALLHGMTKTEIEEIIKKQEVREPKGYDVKYSKEKYETVGCIGGKFFTIQKAENSKEIVVITLWESKEREVDLWVSKKR